MSCIRQRKSDNFRVENLLLGEIYGWVIFLSRIPDDESVADVIRVPCFVFILIFPEIKKDSCRLRTENEMNFKIRSFIFFFVPFFIFLFYISPATTKHRQKYIQQPARHSSYLFKFCFILLMCDIPKYFLFPAVVSTASPSNPRIHK